MAEGLRDALVGTEKSLQSMNNLDVHPRSSQLLLLGLGLGISLPVCGLLFGRLYRFRDTATFEVNVTAC